MKRFAMALALMCALSTSIFAGNMPTGGFVEPPPTESSASSVVVSVILTVLSLR